MKITDVLKKLDNSLDSLIEATYFQEANLYQVVSWIQKAILANKDIEKLLRKRSFVDMNKLMLGNSIISNIVDLEVALNDMEVEERIKNLLLDAYKDYTKWHYDGNGIINATSAKFNARNLNITGEF